MGCDGSHQNCTDYDHPCAGRRKDGQRCRDRTSFTVGGKPYCWRHGPGGKLGVADR
jgi:hypothetical protein